MILQHIWVITGKLKITSQITFTLPRVVKKPAKRKHLVRSNVRNPFHFSVRKGETEDDLPKIYLFWKGFILKGFETFKCIFWSSNIKLLSDKSKPFTTQMPSHWALALIVKYCPCMSVASVTSFRCCLILLPRRAERLQVDLSGTHWRLRYCCNFQRIFDGAEFQHVQVYDVHATTSPCDFVQVFKYSFTEKNVHPGI